MSGLQETHQKAEQTFFRTPPRRWLKVTHGFSRSLLQGGGGMEQKCSDFQIEKETLKNLGVRVQNTPIRA